MKHYIYTVNVGSASATGEVVVADDATDDDIQLAIMEDLYEVTYHELQKTEGL